MVKTKKRSIGTMPGPQGGKGGNVGVSTGAGCEVTATG